jgi:2-amino-4-hydroxy-6-hydroxymethyldihydropteridine diphosphokinase
MFDAKRDDLAQGRVFLGLGSNVGARERNILRAVDRLEAAGGGVVRRVSSLYETEPVGCGPMRPFINAVVEVTGGVGPEELLSRLQKLERELGRSGGHNEPREIDIDIIAMGTMVVQTDALTVPHPRFAERRFVIVPLAEIAPDFVCPASGRPVGRLLDGLVGDGAGVQRISSRKAIATASAQ